MVWRGGGSERENKSIEQKVKALAWLGGTEEDWVFYSRTGLSLHQHPHFVIDFSCV